MGFACIATSRTGGAATTSAFVGMLRILGATRVFGWCAGCRRMLVGSAGEATDVRLNCSSEPDSGIHMWVCRFRS